MLKPGLGVTVLPEWLQVEGVETVLDTLGRAGVTAVSTSPYVMAPAGPEERGAREPPADAGAGEVRLLDRPLWDGERSAMVVTAPSFSPDPKLYEGLFYRPAAATGLTHREGPVVGQFVRAAKGRGLEVYLQVMAAIPPGYRVQFGGPDAEDEPRLPDGDRVPDRVDRNGSLASPAIRAYTGALLRDLARQYPEIDGFRLDWPEYPSYALDALFFDFSQHAMRRGDELGNEVDRLRERAKALYRWCRDELDDGMLDALLASETQTSVMSEVRERFAVDELLRFKAALVLDFLAVLPRDKALVPQVFPPPWTALGGVDLARMAPSVAAIGVKLYTMHWPMMLRAWGETLLSRNRGLDPAKVAKALVLLLDTGGPEPSSVADFRYPEPSEPHPVGGEAQARKIGTARAAVGGRCPVFAISHAYGPRDDVLARARIARVASGGRLWINRYGYLSDEKLAGLGRLGRVS